MSTPLVTIDIVSDIVCPWCWLGKTYLDAALAQTEGVDVQIHWRPYMLDAGIPAQGMPYTQYMQKKFGAGRSDRFKTMREHLEQAAKPVGIEFKFGAIPMRPNTLKAHTLMKWAGEQGKAHQAAEHLFKAFFQDLQDVGDIDVLGGIASAIGMDANRIKTQLREEQDCAVVQAELTYFQTLGVTSVPTFIYNGTFAVSGGQPSEAHKQALQKAATITPVDIMGVLNS